jgi:chromosome partitioning protein
MPVIAVVNRKGGSGKSTLATNIAAWCAHNGWQVMLGDVDRQRSMHSWLSRRSKEAPPVTSWAVDRSRTVRPPSGTTHVVLDTPGALYDHHLAKLVVNVDALVVPIGPSVFDRDASLDFLAELRLLPRVSSGRCLVVAVGMRWPEEERQRWLARGQQWDYPLLTVIPERSVYRTSVQAGASIFDAPVDAMTVELLPWKPLLAWLQDMWAQDHQTSRQVARAGAAEPHNTPPAAAGSDTLPATASAPTPVLAKPAAPTAVTVPAHIQPERCLPPARLRPPLVMSPSAGLVPSAAMVPAAAEAASASASASRRPGKPPSATQPARPGWWQRWFGTSH